MHNSLIDPHSSNVVTPALAQDTRDQCRAFLKTVRFPPVASSPTCSLDNIIGEDQINPPCPSAHWSGMSGCLASPTLNTGYEPNFYSYLNEEHTPINVPDNHRSFRCRDNATIISAVEDPEVPYSGASISSKHTAARSSDLWCNSLWKQMADWESVDSRDGIQEIGPNLDRESIVSTLFRSPKKKRKRDRDQNVVHSLRDRENLHKILERKVDLAVRGERMAQQKLS